MLRIAKCVSPLCLIVVMGMVAIRAFGQYYGFVHLEFTDSAGATLETRVSGIVSYCDNVGTNNLRVLKESAVKDVDRQKMLTQIVPPAKTAKTTVSFYGGSTTRAEAQKEIDYYVKNAKAKTFRSGLEPGDYYPQNVCR